MGRLRRYLTAVNRYRHSLGFGVHSPFAFAFIRGVLRETCQYYAYETIAATRREAVSMIPHGLMKRGVMSLDEARLLFRVTCRFNPPAILQCGIYAGVDSVAMLEVDSRSRLTVCPVDGSRCQVFDHVTQRFDGRITRFAKLDEGASRYFDAIDKGMPFVLVNGTCGDASTIGRVLSAVIERCGVAVVRGVDTGAMRDMWDSTLAAMPYGMSFTNGVTGIITAFSHLPRQHFSLWF
ncbi:MAG: hypothetical protein NC117_10130 [Pseudoflavonifractor sp.]|nr:hypothetical protein [Pseudoflavonifractor sp.]